MTLRNSQPEHDPRDRFALYRLCDCPICGGKGKGVDVMAGVPAKCPECRGEGRIRQEIAACETPEAVGVALVTLAREGEWEECPFGLLDRMPECPECGGKGQESFRKAYPDQPEAVCPTCKGSGVKETGTWLVLPWTPSARNVRDAARTLARSKRTSRKG